MRLPNIKQWLSDTVTVNIWSRNIIRTDSFYFYLISFSLFFFSRNFTPHMFSQSLLKWISGREDLSSLAIINLSCKPLTENALARAALSQLLTMSGKQLFDVWTLKASSGRAANWQDPRSLKAAHPFAKENTTGAKAKLSETRSVKEVSDLSQWLGSAARRKVKIKKKKS